MFSNREAIETLIKTDSSATEKEKGWILALLGCRPLVVSVEKAAYMLGATPRLIYKAVREKRLKGTYGLSGRRMTGVQVESILNWLSNTKACCA